MVVGGGWWVVTAAAAAVVVVFATAVTALDVGTEKDDACCNSGNKKNNCVCTSCNSFTTTLSVMEGVVVSVVSVLLPLLLVL